MQSFLRIIGSISLVLAVGAGAFALTRIFLAGDNNGASAQLAPSSPCPKPPVGPTTTTPTGSVGPTVVTPAQVPTPTGGGTPPGGALPPPGLATVAPPAPQATPDNCLPRNPTVEAISQQLKAESTKPNFVGVLNGINFYGPGFSTLELSRQRSPKCTGQNNVVVSEAQGRASNLNFTPTYLPTGTKPPAVYVGACVDEVVGIAHDYQVNNGSLSIYRNAGPASFDGRFPRDRLESIDLKNGKGGVVASVPRPVGFDYILLLRDEKSLWIISGKDLSREELVKVAEGLR